MTSKHLNAVRQSLAITALVSAGLGIAAAVSAGGPNARQTIEVSPEAAISRVAELAPSDALIAGPVEFAADGPFYTVDGPRIHANVDAHDGHVRTLTLIDQVPHTNEVTVSPDAALQVAVAYLSTNRVAADGLTPSVRLVDHGATAAFVISWQRRVNGALTPDKREVSINPSSGAVFSYVNISVPYVDPPSAKVSLAEATTNATELLGVASVEVRYSDLMIWFAKSGDQVLVWALQLKTPDGGAALVLTPSLEPRR